MFYLKKKTTTLLEINHRPWLRWLLPGLIGVSLIACIRFGEPYKGIPPGIWRGVLYLSESNDGFDEKSKGELPFNFEVIYDDPDSFHIVIHNGDERILVTDIHMGVDRRTARDTLRIDFPVYDSHIEAQAEEDAIEGYWVVHNRKDYRIKFSALNGQSYRFFQLMDPPAADLSGFWNCNFEIDTDHPTHAIGQFKQDSNHITGTFMTATGDDRYLEGVVNGNRLFLSVFDGSHAYLYEAKIMPDGQLTGIYRSGNHYKTYWEGQRTDSLDQSYLGDPLQLTKIKSKEPVTLNLRDQDGQLIDLNKGVYNGKPKILQVMGTWCPNCRDETTFLLEYLKQHPDPGFEILGIAFERHTDTLKANAAIHTYREKLNIPYPIVYGGSNDKEKALATLPMLDKVVAFPTLIFLNSHNQVVAIHTGFAGPATPTYPAFKNEFDQLVTQMMASHE